MTCGKTVLITFFELVTHYFGHDGKAIKNRFYQWVMTGTTSMRMVQLPLVPFKLPGKSFTDTNHGRQVKGAFAPDGHYYDENLTELVTNQTRTIKGVTYHFDEKW